MSRFAELPIEEREPYIQEAAARLGVLPLIIEKDFWVCWILGRIFGAPAVGPHIVFKGGTSLSKVFQAIQRFSEDIDLSVSPMILGFSEAELDNAPQAANAKSCSTNCKKPAPRSSRTGFGQNSKRPSASGWDRAPMAGIG